MSMSMKKADACDGIIWNVKYIKPRWRESSIGHFEYAKIIDV